MSVFQKKYRFCFRNLQSPTVFNLIKYLSERGWKSTRFNWLAHFNETNLQFNTAATEYLEFKHLLARLVSQYCPESIPETFQINDQNWQEVLNQIADKYYWQGNQLLDNVDNLAWILKPSLLNNGQNIKIFKGIGEIEQHYLTSRRLGGEHVLQQYITQPHLINDHKYSIRMFVILTSYAGAYIYPEGYFNVALSTYKPNEFNELSAHITNEHLKEPESNVKQIQTHHFDFFSSLYPQIRNIISKTINGLHHIMPQEFNCINHRTVAIFGFDFMVDVNLRVWLLEANHGPCFPISDAHPLQKKLYYEFWQAFIDSFVIPIAIHQPPKDIQYQLFEDIIHSNKRTRNE